MFERIKRSLYLSIGHKTKSFISGNPIKVTILDDWVEEEFGEDQSSYLAFPNKWRARPDIVLLEEQNYMLLIVTAINRIFENKDDREPTIEFVSRYGYHVVASFKKYHKNVQLCDVKMLCAFVTHTMLRLTKNKYRIRVIFAEKKLAIFHFGEMLQK